MNPIAITPREGGREASGEFFHGKTRLSRQAEAALLIFRRRVRFSTLAGPRGHPFSNGARSQNSSSPRPPIIDRANSPIRHQRLDRFDRFEILSYTWLDGWSRVTRRVSPRDDCTWKREREGERGFKLARYKYAFRGWVVLDGKNLYHTLAVMSKVIWRWI